MNNYYNYHHRPQHHDPEPSTRQSPFRRVQQEEDDAFYSTFPEAKQSPTMDASAGQIVYDPATGQYIHGPTFVARIVRDEDYPPSFHEFTASPTAPRVPSPPPPPTPQHHAYQPVHHPLPQLTTSGIPFMHQPHAQLPSPLSPLSPPDLNYIYQTPSLDTTSQHIATGVPSQEAFLAPSLSRMSNHDQGYAGHSAAGPSVQVQLQSPVSEHHMYHASELPGPAMSAPASTLPETAASPTFDGHIEDHLVHPPFVVPSQGRPFNFDAEIARQERWGEEPVAMTNPYPRVTPQPAQPEPEPHPVVVHEPMPTPHVEHRTAGEHHQHHRLHHTSRQRTMDYLPSPDSTAMSPTESIPASPEYIPYNASIGSQSPEMQATPAAPVAAASVPGSGLPVPVPPLQPYEQPTQAPQPLRPMLPRSDTQRSSSSEALWSQVLPSTSSFGPNPQQPQQRPIAPAPAPAPAPSPFFQQPHASTSSAPLLPSPPAYSEHDHERAHGGAYRRPPRRYMYSPSQMHPYSHSHPLHKGAGVGPSQRLLGMPPLTMRGKRPQVMGYEYEHEYGHGHGPPPGVYGYPHHMHHHPHHPHQHPHSLQHFDQEMYDQEYEYERMDEEMYEGEGLTPPPSPSKQDKKPRLACLFCRGRKIACGPPMPGSKDRTCNQCQRRSLKCEYPTESRRGMRKKKSDKGKAAEGASDAAEGSAAKEEDADAGGDADEDDEDMDDAPDDDGEEEEDLPAAASAKKSDSSGGSAKAAGKSSRGSKDHPKAKPGASDADKARDASSQG
ncbi:hypothetical protein HGRIS_003046 [Hohenbuehelia grisea]|uniref:Zn(2)-C6 fungal-type domain-containing protein n=1 Tax=Hohenbuehelia grisea TaxID=104357 RepID=A0ABR3JMA2_9AGAR